MIWRSRRESRSGAVELGVMEGGVPGVGGVSAKKVACAGNLAIGSSCDVVDAQAAGGRMVSRRGTSSLRPAFLLYYSSTGGMIMPATALHRERETLSEITPIEAAWLTELSPKTINATIDRGELGRATLARGSGAKRERRLAPADVVYLALRKELAEFLSQRAKAELYERLVQLQWSDIGRWRSSPNVQSDFEVGLAGGVVRIDLTNTCRRLATRWAALCDATQLVVSDPEVRGGEPVLRNTRVPVYLIADLVQQGAGLKEILEDYPSLDAAMVRSALAYAQTRPRRGRPHNAPWKK
jgi:uncharacterized protein (DUF433 family)